MNDNGEYLRRVGERIRQTRFGLGLVDQGDAARFLGLSQPYLSKIESGGSLACLELVNRLADLLGVSVDYLALRTDDPSPKHRDPITDATVVYQARNEHERAMLQRVCEMLGLAAPQTQALALVTLTRLTDDEGNPGSVFEVVNNHSDVRVDA